jgi:hypothetical protein
MLAAPTAHVTEELTLAAAEAALCSAAGVFSRPAASRPGLSIRSGSEGRRAEGGGPVHLRRNKSGPGALSTRATSNGILPLATKDVQLN